MSNPSKSFGLVLASLVMLCSSPVKAQTPAPGCPNVTATGKDKSLTLKNDTLFLKCGQDCAELEAGFLQGGLTTSYRVNPIPYAPPFPFTGGVNVFIGVDDKWSAIIPLPFNFCFYGNVYNQLVVGANGIITFDILRANTACCWCMGPTIPTPNDPVCEPANGLICVTPGVYDLSINGAFHDMDPSVGGGTINYAVLGTAPCRTFVMNYNNIAHYSCNNLRTTQQIVLYETTNAIEVYIKNKPVCGGWNSGLAVIGLQNSGGTAGIVAPGRNTAAWNAMDEAWRFTPNGAPNYQIDWFTMAGANIGSGPNVNVCIPSLAPTKYAVRIVYTNCDNTTVTERDTVTVFPKGDLDISYTKTNVSCFDSCDGSGLISIDEGDGPFTIKWPNGDTALAEDSLCAGNYKVTVTDKYNCTDSVEFAITQPPKLQTTVTVQNILCAGQTNGTARITATGGTPGYDYSWSNGAVTNNITAGGGKYYVTVTDSNNCSTKDSAVITEPPPLKLDTTVTHLTCEIAKDGRIVLMASGGTPPYQYSKDSINFSTQSTFSGLSKGRYLVSVRDNNNCRIDKVVILTADSVRVDAPADIKTCKGQPVTLKASGYATSFNWNNGVIDGVAFTPSFIGTTMYIVSGRNKGGCLDEDTVLVTVNDSPALTVDSTVCNNNSDAYRVYITIKGGDSTSYKINGTPQAGKKFVSNPIPSATGYSFTVTDKNNCPPVSAVSGNKNCGCKTDAGTMDTALVAVCGGTPATGRHMQDHVLDANDVLVFVLHDNPGISLGTVIALNKNAPTFVYSPSWGIQQGQPYYISAVAGDPDPSDPGKVNFQNPNGCMSVAPGQPVVFNPLPDVTAVLSESQICRGESVDIIFSFTSGKEDFDIIYNDGNTPAFISGRTSQNNTFRLTPANMGVNNYNITQITDANNCSSQLNIPLSVTVIDFPDTANVSVNCNSTNTAYTVSFTITGADQQTYAVNGMPAGNSFTSPAIPSGSPYSFWVSDGNKCDSVLVSGTHTCPCITEAGSMTLGPGASTQEFCISNSLSAAHNSDQVLDGNDVLSFILSTDAANPMNSILAINSSPVFPFDSTYMEFDKIYYICPIAGDNDGQGLVDLTATCIDDGPGSPVAYLQPPVVSLSDLNEICQGTPVLLYFDGAGSPGKSVAFRVTRTDSSSSIMSLTVMTGQKTSTTVYPDGSMDMYDSVRFFIDPASVRYANQPQCIGKAVGNGGRFKVNPAPTAAIVAPDNFTLCSGESINLNFSTTGEGNITVQFRDITTQTDYTFTRTQLSSYKHLVTPQGPGVHTYQITSVSASTGGVTCSGSYSGTAAINVRPAPSGSFSLSKSSICLGESVSLNFMPNGSFGPYRFRYHNSSSQGQQVVLVYGQDTSIAVTPSDSMSFTLDSIADGTVSSASGKNCATFVNQTLDLVVHPLPVAEIGGSKEICQGDTLFLFFDFTGSDPAAVPYRTVYQNSMGQQPAETLFAQGSSASAMVTPTDTASYVLVEVMDVFGCKATSLTGTAYIPVNPIPVPIVAATDSSNCPPLVTKLLNLTDPMFLGDYTWDFGDVSTLSGSGTTNSDPNKIYYTPGSYTIRLEVTSPAGCFNDTILKDFLTVYPKPVADFNWTPNPATFTNTRITFLNQSVNGAVYEWYFFNSDHDTLGRDTLVHPLFLFPSADTGSYPITLITHSAFGCSDTITQKLFIKGELVIFTPNTFTPNGDGMNDNFLPVMAGFEVKDYELWIFNRWGEKLFYSTHPDQGWDGTYKGEKVKPDVYAFRVRARSAYDADKRELTGKVQLLR